MTARIGSLPWFAGLWWFVLGSALQGLAWLAFLAGDRVGWRALRRQALPLCGASRWCYQTSVQCSLGE